MTDTRHCAQCGAPLPADIAPGICPQCELRGALNPSDEPTQTSGTDLGSAEQPSRSTFIAGPLDSEPAGVPGQRRFGDYELLEEIARGGMGVVFKARQVSLDRIVAVKMILGGLATKEFVQRFRTEASAAASLKHPNIVAIHEVGVHEGEHFLAMDFVDGPNLSQLVARRAVPPKQAGRYLKLIAEAVHFAHERNILHRDLKPANVLIDSNDQPHVTDFGLAKRLEADTDLTLSGQVLGSPNYISPEQAEGKRGAVGRRSDVYSLGAILYFLLTGRAPFQGQTLTEILHQVTNNDPLAPRLLMPRTPRDLETICLKCLEKEPSRRYATAQELADDLERFLQDEPIHARPVTRPERAWRWCQRKPALAGSLAIAAILLLIVAIGSPIAALHINRGRVDAQREARRAEAGETAFRLSAYASDMNVAEAALRQHDLLRARQLLDRWIPTNAESELSDLRGWEWRYLRSLCRSDERVTLTRPETKHSGFIISVAYSPDGKWLASGSHDGRVKLFDLATHREVAELRHARAVRSVAFSPRDSTLTTLCADGFLRFWDVQTRSNVGVVPARAYEYFGALAFSHDGAWLAFSDAPPGWITVSNLMSRTSFATNAHIGDLTGLSFSPDATLLASRDRQQGQVGNREDPGEIKLWEVHSDRLVLKHVFPHTGWGVSTVAFSPDGRRLVTTSVDQTLKLWDVESGQLLHTQKSPVGNPSAALFLPDGNTLAVANFDYTITLWDVTTKPWRERAVLKDNGRTWGLALSPDGTELASGDASNGNVKLWSTTPASEQNDWLPWPTNAFAWCFSTDARSLLLALTNGTVELWNSAALTKIATLTWSETNVSTIAFHSDGKTIVSGGKDGTVKLWRVAGGSLQEKRSFELGTNRITQLALSPNGKTIAAASPYVVMLSDAESGQKLFESDQISTYKLKFSPDNARLVSTSADGKVKLWQVESGRRVWTGKHEQTAIDAAFFPDGRRIVTAAWEPKARLWDAASGRELMTLPGAASVAVSPDGRRVAIGNGEGTVKLFMFGAAQQPLELATLVCRANESNAVAFLPDGETLVARCREGFQVWRAPTFEEIAAKEKMEARR